MEACNDDDATVSDCRSEQDACLTQRTPAHVQDSTAKPVGSSTGARLDEVLVTAQRRREPMQKVPISMTVLGEQQIVPGCGDTIAANFSSATSEAVRVSNLLNRIGETDLPTTRRYAVDQSRAPPASR